MEVEHSLRAILDRGGGFQGAAGPLICGFI
jgi:hypothetical protein